MSAQSNDPFHEFEHAQWQAVVERYHDSWGDLTRQTIPALLDVLRVKAGVRLLDVASGPGYVASEARSRGADVVGVDFSEAMVARARVLYPDTHFQEGNAENLPFADASFDAVAMNFGMLHLAQPDLAINEAFRVLRSGGRFAFTVWAGPDQTVAFAMVLSAVKDFGEPVNLPAGPDFFRFSSSEACTDALHVAGFDDTRTCLIELTWRLDQASDFFGAFYGGTARTGALLRGQPRDARGKIESALQKTAARFETPDGGLEIPMAAMMASGRRS